MGLRDPVSSLSHLLAAVCAAYGVVVLLRLTPAGTGRRPYMALYGASMVALYLASGIYHAVPFSSTRHPGALKLLETIDRSAVFLLIAGTNTPLMATLLQPPWRRRCLGGIWSVAAAGVLSLWLLPKPPFGLTVAVYIAMGWLGCMPLVHYVRAVGWRSMSWALSGGVLYTAGAVCDVVRWPELLEEPVRIGSHEVLHFATIAGSVAFYIFIFRHVARYGWPSAPDRPTARAVRTFSVRGLKDPKKERMEWRGYFHRSLRPRLARTNRRS